MTTAMTTATTTIDIEFLYIDLTTCTRCRGTDESLGRALDAVRSVLSATGRTVNLKRMLIDSEEKARAHRFRSSPTIRVNGRDAALGTKESRCGSCGDIAGQATDCRVWVYEGAEYTEAPDALLVDAILHAAYAPPAPAEPEPYPGVPENLLRFFDAKATMPGGPCCPTAEGDASCCGTVVAPPEPAPNAAACGCGNVAA